MADENAHRTGVGLGHWGDQFPDTHWSILISSANDAPDSERERQFSELCKRYWYPLYAYLRRRGRSSHDAQDLTQGFFAHLLSQDRIGGLDRERGKFRSYLLGAMGHYLNDRRKYENAQKRGGGKVPLSIEAELAENRFKNEPSDDLSAEKLFDRRWALTVIADTKVQLEKESIAQGKEAVFRELSAYLTATPEAGEYAETAQRLGVTEENVRAMVSRLRKRFRTILREAVRATVSSDEEIDEEIRHLLRSFG